MKLMQSAAKLRDISRLSGRLVPRATAVRSRPVSAELAIGEGWASVERLGASSDDEGASLTLERPQDYLPHDWHCPDTGGLG
jgi:hypothetical protein